MILSRVCSLAGSFLASRELGELGCHSQISTCNRKYTPSPGVSVGICLPRLCSKWLEEAQQNRREEKEGYSEPPTSSKDRSMGEGFVKLKGQ